MIQKLLECLGNLKKEHSLPLSVDLHAFLQINISLFLRHGGNSLISFLFCSQRSPYQCFLLNPRFTRADPQPSSICLGVQTMQWSSCWGQSRFCLWCWEEEGAGDLGDTICTLSWRDSTGIEVLSCMWPTLVDILLCMSPSTMK